MIKRKRDVLFWCAGSLLLALVIGCGGSGGGSSSSNGGVGETAATTGTLGNFPQDVILYSRFDGFNYTTYRIDPDGSNNAIVASYSSLYTAYAPSPAVGDSRVAFSYGSTENSTDMGVYVNTSVDISGATTIDAGPYFFIGSLQFTPDGSRIIYVAESLSDDNPGLYVANSDGSGTPVRLDDADDAHLSPSGTKIVYTRFFSQEEICLRNIDGTGFARLTNNSGDDFSPQWSKDGLQIFFTSDRAGTSGIWRMTANGTNPQAVTASNDEYASSPNTGATQVAFTRFSFNPAESGIYVVDVNGANETPIQLQTDIDPSLVYWTGTNGRAVGGGLAFSMSHVSPRIEKLIRH